MAAVAQGLRLAVPRAAQGAGYGAVLAGVTLAAAATGYWLIGGFR
jgi:hypothetical protein